MADMTRPDPGQKFLTRTHHYVAPNIGLHYKYLMIIWLQTLLRLDSDIIHPYGWFDSMGTNESYPPNSKELFDMSYPSGNGNSNKYFHI